MTPEVWAAAIRHFLSGPPEWEWLATDFDENPLGHVVIGPNLEGDNDEGLQAIVGWDDESGWHLFVIDIESGEDACESQEHLHSRRAAQKRGEVVIVGLARKRLALMMARGTEQVYAAPPLAGGDGHETERGDDRNGDW